MNKPLYLPIEIKKRELLPKMLLGLTALKKGFIVIIGDKIAVSHAIDFFGPGVYFYKSMNFNDTKHITRCAIVNICHPWCCDYLLLNTIALDYKCQIATFRVSNFI